MEVNELSEQQKAVHQRLQTDLEYYCRKALFIETKGGNIKPFIWNKAQRYIHERVEAQKAETGMVRALILKGRQQGCSTYVTARYFSHSVWMSHKHTYILSHEKSSTETLLGKVDMYYEKCPDVIRPGKNIGNKTELEFDNHSTYKVGTAGAKNTGRSQTNQYFHGSEVAFYDNTVGISTGVLQTISDEAGTEIILESTANGVGNYFHKACMDAQQGRGKFILIFVPWFWQDEYRARVPKGWDFTPQELELADMYDLDEEQLYWRYLKIIELKSEWMFKQEYPFTVAEAFQASGDTFFSSDDVHRARKSTLTDEKAPLVLGVDPARKGDRTVLCFRRGREIVEVKCYDEMDSMRLSGIIAQAIDRRGVTKCFVDFGLGYGTVDRLTELGYGRIVQGVHFGERPLDSRYLNKRAEMAFDLRDWLAEGGCSIPDDEDIETDLMAIPDFKQNSRGLLYLEAKDKIKEAYGKSPDIFDAMILTFAYPVHSEAAHSLKPRRTENTKSGSQLKTLSRIRSHSKAPDAAEYEPDYPQQRDKKSWRKR